MSDATKIATQIAAVPLHEAVSAKVQDLTDQYSQLLIAQAKIVAYQAGSVQVSPLHVESAYHKLRQSSSSGWTEAMKLFSGAIFGVGVTLLPIALQAKPVDVLLTVVGVFACVLGVGMMSWIAGTQK
ncbi:MAG TPA: hypothetical protein VFS20_21015 [Longimicrobium sp.]|nr:hypothetical protein [Longimicrobium sp.]